MRKFLSYLLLSLVVSLPANAANTQMFKLKNGLKLLVKHVPRPGVVVAMIWYKVGSADEPGGISGISHVLEHMMFKGTPNYGPNAYSKIIAENGGQDNAFTNRDYTAYFAKISTKTLPTFLKLEADRLKNLTLNEKEFGKEINVVKEERRMRTDDNPKSLTYERFLAQAHLASPYHKPTVGWMNDLDNMKVTDLRNWYNTWYAPNNATIVLVGDIKGTKALKLVRQYFGDIKTKPLPKRKPQREPRRLGKRVVEVNLKAKLPLLVLGFNTPSVMTAKDKKTAYALEVLAGVLDGGQSARLEKELIRGQHVASQIAAYYSLYARYDSLFILYGVPHNIKQMNQLQSALMAQVKRLQTKPVDAKELARIKNQVIAAKVFEQDSVFGQAMELGLLETIGIGHKESDNYIKQIESITAGDLMQVAKEYLVPNNMTKAVLRPIANEKESKKS